MNGKFVTKALILDRKPLQKGFNSFLLQYAKYIDDAGKSDDMNMKIEYIIVDGVRNADRECKKCVNSFSKQGSDTCNFCKANQYLNEATVKNNNFSKVVIIALIPHTLFHFQLE